MGLLLALTLPLHMIWTRKNPDYRVAPSELISEIRTRGYIWHISLYLAMFVFKAFTDYHNEPLKAMVGGFTHVVYSIEGDLVYHIQNRFRNDLVSEILSLHYLRLPVHHMVSSDTLHTFQGSRSRRLGSHELLCDIPARSPTLSILQRGSDIKLHSRC